MATQVSKVADLIQSAKQEGTLSPALANKIQIVDMGEEINNALGVSIDKVAASEILLLTSLVDDSGSIADASHEQEVRDGHNLVIRKMQRVKQKAGILAHTRYLNGKILFPFANIDDATLMDGRNYKATGGTPLYDMSFLTLMAVLLKSQESIDNGDPVRTLTLIISDGADTTSRRVGTSEVEELVKRMRAFEDRHIVAGMGIYDGQTDFRAIFRMMGIPDRWIWEPTSDPKDIADAFGVWSESAVRASQSAKSFSQTNLGGFTNP